MSNIVKLIKHTNTPKIWLLLVCTVLNINYKTQVLTCDDVLFSNIVFPRGVK